MPAPGLRLSNVILRVAQLKRSLEFYRDRLGLQVHFANEERAMLDAGGVVLMLEQARSPTDAKNAGLSALTELVLEAPDVRASHEALASRGIAFRVPLRPVTSAGDRDLLAADFRDPDEHVVSLTGWVPRAPR